MTTIIITAIFAIAGGAITGLASKDWKKAITYGTGVFVLCCMLFFTYLGTRIIEKNLTMVLSDFGKEFKKEVKADIREILTEVTGNYLSENINSRKNLFVSAITIIRNPEIGNQSLEVIEEEFSKTLRVFDTISRATASKDIYGDFSVSLLPPLK